MRTVTSLASRAAFCSGLTVLATLLAGCLGSPESKTNFEIDVAPLTLPGIDEACYDLVVRNGTAATVWSKTGICSTEYGNGRGAITYIGTCDAQEPNHTIALSLTSLSANAIPLVHPRDFVNPTASGPIILQATCRENADTRVTFDLTVMRSAQQGFFDIAVNFDDLFCSAKLDCDAGAVLHDPTTQARIPTAVAGLACTAGPGAATHLYYSNLSLVCDGVPTTLSLAHAPGNFFSATSPAPGPFAQIASYHGVEQLSDDGTPLGKVFFNLAFGLPAGATGNCSLSYSATVSDGPLDDCSTPEDGVYPVIHVTAPGFVTNGAFACGDNPLDASDGVATTYVGPVTTEHFDVEAHAVGNTLEVTSCGFCGDGIRDPALEACDPPDATPCTYGEASCQRCSATCEVIAGTPTGSCGDGTVQSPNESCDPPNATPCAYGDVSCDRCTSDCQTVPGTVVGFCGDGTLQSPESCDPPDATPCAYGQGGCERCTDTCETVPGTVVGFCGDNVIQAGLETCDPPDGSLECAPGVTNCNVCTAQCQTVTGIPGPPVTPVTLSNGAPNGCVEQTGTSTHCIIAKVSCDDACEVWLDGVKQYAFDDSYWWTPKTIVLSGVTSGCHVLGVHTKDVYNVAAGFVGTISIDGAEPGEDGHYVTAQTNAITVRDTAPPDAQGDHWSTMAYDTVFPTAVQCSAIDTWNASPWMTWGRQYYNDGAYPIWYNSQCAGEHTDAYARIVFTVPENGTICEPSGPGLPGRGMSYDNGETWTAYNPNNTTICGDGILEAPEQCDPPAEPANNCAYGQTCQGCGPTCQTISVTGPRCGDGIKNGPEVCEGSNVPTCAELDPSKPFGTVTCNGSCAPITTNCSADPCFGKPTTYTGNLTYTSGPDRLTPNVDFSCITRIDGRVVAKPPYDGTLPTWTFPKLTLVDGVPLTSGSTFTVYPVDLDNPPASFPLARFEFVSTTLLRVSNLVSSNAKFQSSTRGVFVGNQGGTITYTNTSFPQLHLSNNRGTQFNFVASTWGSFIDVRGNQAFAGTPTRLVFVGGVTKIATWDIVGNPAFEVSASVSTGIDSYLTIENNAAATKFLLTGTAYGFFFVTGNLFTSANLSLPVYDIIDGSSGGGFTGNGALSTCWIRSYIATLSPADQAGLSVTGNLADCP